MEKVTAHTSPEKVKPFLFNPYEIAFCGYKNSGKTSLVCRMIKELCGQFRIGYVKSDVHGFQMDREGKDTFNASKNGASEVFINDPTHYAYIHSGSIDHSRQRTMLLEPDIVFLEGYKKSDVPKVVLVDGSDSDLDSDDEVRNLNRYEFKNIFAYVGKQESKPRICPSGIPYFHRDDINGIKQSVLDQIRLQVERVPLYGLVLAGGKSSRMRVDKASLSYGRQPQVKHCFDILSSKCKKVFVSSRKEQAASDWPGRFPQIHDIFLELGPLGGIMSAMTTYPNAAWLVLGCDLPHAGADTIQRLIDGRNPFKIATAYIVPHVPQVSQEPQDSHEVLEPLCTVYEPKCRQLIFRLLGLGYSSLRRMLLESDVKRLMPPSELSLVNVNYPLEYEAARELLER